MVDAPKSPEDEAEWYASTYAHFLTEIKLLSEEADAQCALKKYDNVAWELKHFILSSADAVLNLPGGQLSEIQRSSIRQFVAEVTAIPDDVVNVTNSVENHRRAMRDPHWQPIRTRAAELLRQLESETKRVDAILWPPDNVSPTPKRGV